MDNNKDYANKIIVMLMIVGFDNTILLNQTKLYDVTQFDLHLSIVTIELYDYSHQPLSIEFVISSFFCDERQFKI